MLQSEGPALFTVGSFYTPQISSPLPNPPLPLLGGLSLLLDTHREDGHDHVDGPCSSCHILDVVAFHTRAEVDLVSIVVDLEENRGVWQRPSGVGRPMAHPQPSGYVGAAASVPGRTLPSAPLAHGMPVPHSLLTAAGQP